MKKFCTRFQNTILLILKALLYGGSGLIFFALLGIDSRQVLVLSRTSVVMVIMYVMAMFMLTKIYGGFDIARRKRRSVFLSSVLAIILSSIATYFIFLVMSVNDANSRQFRFISFNWFLLTLVLQIILTAFLVFLGVRFINWVRPPLKTLIVLSNEESGSTANRVISGFPGRYTVEKTILYNDPDIRTAIRRSGAVFFYDVPAGERTELVNYCYKHLVDVYLNPDISDIVEMTSEQIMFGDIPFLAHTARKMTFEQRIMKRLSDIFVSLFFLILLSPLFLITAIAIKLEDRGKVFFRQKRATIHGRVFEIYKFRTMRENVKNFSVTKDDDRITRVGRVLRKYRIDELPQFLNIIRGDMSLVGPRPEMLENISEYEREMPEFRYRLRMKAGLTGYAQIMGRYNTTSRDKLILDLLYIENFSILLDMKLLLQTILVIFNAEDSTEGF
ncbi:MAG: sugar transferase [Lachnospiraceae bacterium]|nr:sugar transferase [Lachnospiraceae bacterium]